MTAADLIARLRYLGAGVVRAGDSVALRFPDATPTEGLRDELAPALAEHRDAVLAAFAAGDEYAGHECGECGAGVYVADPEQVFRLCGRVMCPAWNRHLPNSPDWLAKARSYEQWRRQRDKDRSDTDIPE